MLDIVLELPFVEPTVVVENGAVSVFHRFVVDSLDVSEVDSVLVLLNDEVGDVNVLERLTVRLVFLYKPLNSIFVEGLADLMLMFEFCLHVPADN